MHKWQPDHRGKLHATHEDTADLTAGDILGALALVVLVAACFVGAAVWV